MIFTIRRTYEPLATIGTLSYQDQPFCKTVERTRDGDHPCIPEGTYTASRYNSPKHGPNTWQLDNVPGRTNIQFHICHGKTSFLDYVFPKFLLGCISPGNERIERNGLVGVGGSIDAYDRFMELTRNEKKITFVIEEDK